MKNKAYTPQEAERIQTIGPKLADWYEQNGRQLPWRIDRNAYRIWVAEIMLQQTRIEAAKPYFFRFTAELPTVEALAQVQDERLMKLWEGLGYYSRARNLKKCAQTVMEQHGGKLPADYDALKKLPGIGPYTAGAIASMAYGIAVPAVDGNVLRVLARILASREDITLPAVRKRAEQLLLDHMPKDRPGQFNEGIMELGETVCIPKGKPLCDQCPLKADCLGCAAGIQEELPVRTPKKARRIEQRTVFILRCGEEILLRKRPEKGLLAGLYELPSLDGRLTAEEVRQQLPALLQADIPLLKIEPIADARHIFTHVEWQMTGYAVELPPEAKEKTAADCLFVDRSARKTEYALPSAFRAFEPWL